VFLLSSQTLQNILKIFLKSLAQQKGIGRNLLIKKFIKNILYSKEQIQINLYYLPREIEDDKSMDLLHNEDVISRGEKDFDAFKKSNIPSGVGWGGDKKEKGISISLSENPQFVMSKMALLSKTLRTIPIVLPNTIHYSKQRNLKK